MAITLEKLNTLLKIFFSDANDTVIVNDMAGDGEHYEVIVTSRKFVGISLLQQHRIVYDALGSCVGKELHALKLKTIVKNN